MSASPEKKASGRSCFVLGCLSLVALFVVGIVALVLITRHYVRSSIEKYTDATPQQLEAVTLTAAESAALEERLQEFARALEQTNQPAQLALDSREINAVIAREPGLAGLKDTVRVQLEGNELKCVLSLPLDVFSGIPFLGGLKGRYVNASASVRVLLEDGLVATRLVEARVRGNALPPEVLAEIEKSAPWKEWQQDPKVQELIRKIDWLKIADGKVQIGRDQPGP